MKLSISQPYFFPYIGFFQLIDATDLMIVFDTVQYKRRSWMNRNRVLHPNKEFNYIKVPVHKNEGLIKDVQIVSEFDWKKTIEGQLTVYAKKAPFYKEVMNLLNECFEVRSLNYSYVTIKYIQIICNYLEIDFHYEFLSKLNLNLPKEANPGEWSLLITKELQYGSYVNLPGGVDIFEEALFKKKGIELKFLNPNLNRYKQFNETFSSHLSIIDVLMWNSKDEVRNMIKKYQLLSKKELINEK